MDANQKQNKAQAAATETDIPPCCLPQGKKKAWECQFTPCSFGLSATNQQQYFSLRTKQPSPTSQQYISLRINQHRPSNHQPNGQAVSCRLCWD
jgi:hypothetical protein